MRNIFSYIIFAVLFSTNAVGATYLNGDTVRSPDRTKVWSMPSATDTLVGRATADTLTNKSISGASNTLSNIPNSATTATNANTANAIVARDANANTTINNLIENYATTATAGSTTTLTVSSAYQQYFTGTLAQSVQMPVTSTLVVGQQYQVVNLSTGIVTLLSSGGNTITTLPPNTSVVATCISTSGTTAASWSAISGGSGGVSAWAASFPYAAGNLVTYGGSIYTAIGSFTSGSSFEADMSANNWKYVGKNNSIKNIVLNGDFEDGDASGWTAMGCATLTNGIPACVGSGGAALSSSNGGRAAGASTLPASVDTNSNIEGKYALNIGTNAAGTIGDGYVSPVYYVEPINRGRVLSFDVAFKLLTGSPVMGGTSSDTYAIAWYDPTNNQFMPQEGGQTGIFSFTQSSGVGHAKGTFQTLTNTAGLQAFIYSPVAPTGLSAIVADAVTLVPQTLVYGPLETDVIKSTTVTMSGFGTISGLSYSSRRVGDSLEVQGYFTAGTVAGTQAQIGVVFNNAAVTVDTSKIGAGQVVGHLGINSQSATYFTQAILAPSSNQSYVNVGVQTSGTNELAPANGNNVSGTGGIVGFYFTVPIVGWGSNQLLSSDADTRVIGALYTGAPPTGTLNGSLNTVTFGTQVKDTNAAYSGGTYTVSSSGLYDIAAQVDINNASVAVNGNIMLALFINGVETYDNVTWFPSTSLLEYTPSISVKSVPLNAGDTVVLKASSSGTTPVYVSNAKTNRFSISKQSGPSQIASSETISARYHNATATVTTTYSDVTFSTKDRDDHAAVSGASFTCPISGWYSVKASIYGGGTWALNGYQALSLVVGGVQWSETTDIAGGAVGNMVSKIVDDAYCAAGSAIKIQVKSSATTPTVVNNNVDNFFSVTRLGN